MEKKKYLVGIFLLLAILVAWIWFTHKSREEAISMQPVVRKSTRRVEAGGDSLKKLARKSGRYPFDRIQSQFEKKNIEFGRCLLKNREFQGNEITIVAFWKPSGVFHRIQVDQNLGDDLLGCISRVIQSFSLPPHPGLQPFSYRMKMSL